MRWHGGLDDALLPARRGTPREILIPKTTADFTLATRRRITHIRHRRTIKRNLKRKERLHTLTIPYKRLMSIQKINPNPIYFMPSPREHLLLSNLSRNNRALQVPTKPWHKNGLARARF